MWKKIVSLLAICSVAQSSELDDLINSSNSIIEQIDRGVMLVGAASQFAHTGSGLSNGQLSTTAHISGNQVEAYNNALSNFSNNYLPYGSVKQVLEIQAMESLNEMESHIDTFVDVTVDLVSVQQVAEKAQEAIGNPQEEEQVQTFVAENQEVLVIQQEDVETFNQALDDIESSANEASAYLAVANSEAVDFLQQSVEEHNTTANDVNIFYDANAQWVAMGYSTTRNLTAVMLNRNDYYGLDMYYSEADILAVGADSEFYQTSPVAIGYKCFFEMDCQYD